MAADVTVYVVDDDTDARASVCALVASNGISTESFDSGEAFLDAYESDRGGCLVTDYRMLGITGIELQQELADRGCHLPVIMLTAFARTKLTVQAVRNGAITVLDKPYNDDELWDAIERALILDRQRSEQRIRVNEIRKRLNALTESERQVLQLVIDGVPNKVIANRLEVSVRTVENRRHEIFRKMQAESVAELVRLVMEMDRAAPRQLEPDSGD